MKQSALWRIRRYFTLKTLKELIFEGTPITDAHIRDWAELVVETGVKGPFSEKKIRGWSDRTLKNGLLYLDLLRALKDDLIDPDQVYTDLAGFNFQVSTFNFEESMKCMHLQLLIFNANRSFCFERRNGK